MYDLETKTNYPDPEWYETLVEDCKSIITEAVFTSRWALVQGYWEVGQRIREEEGLKKWAQKEAGRVLQDLAKDLNVSTRTLHYSLQAYDKYPNLDTIPEGKNITWNKLITKYLPQPKENIVDSPLPEGVYDVIYADPPWKYDFSETESREIENKYPTLSLEEIKKMAVPSADNSVLFLWVTAPKLKEALEVMDSWGFEYKTHMVWDKEIIGMGYWFRGRHELLLVGVKGEVSPPEPSRRRESVRTIRRGEHSSKPAYFREMIQSYFPESRKLELFAREESEGWEVWGNEI